jgi:large subunit ribosomal protein L22
MAYTNLHRGARISPTKVRPVIDMIRGKSLAEAEAILLTCKRRGAVFVSQALKAATANADSLEADVRRLVVSEARVDAGPTIKRFQPKDRGRAHPIKKRTCHICVSVEERD